MQAQTNTVIGVNLIMVVTESTLLW